MTSLQDIRVEHDPDAQLIHAVNSQLIEYLFGAWGVFRGSLVDTSFWIINVLYLHGDPNVAPTLRTSSTLHQGKLYDHRTSPGHVQSIDEMVPLASSVCGRCVLSGRPIWLGPGELSSSHEGVVGRYYRRFSLVDVMTTGKKPLAEIVFPVSIQHVNVSNTIGVLNLELFGYDTPIVRHYLEKAPRESINATVCDLLSIHAAYLKIGLDILNLEPCRGISAGQELTAQERPLPFVTSLVALHEGALNLFVNRNWADISLLQRSMKKIRGTPSDRTSV
jgi:hypothetical protein